MFLYLLILSTTLVDPVRSDAKSWLKYIDHHVSIDLKSKTIEDTYKKQCLKIFVLYKNCSLRHNNIKLIEFRNTANYSIENIPCAKFQLKAEQNVYTGNLLIKSHRSCSILVRFSHFVMDDSGINK